MLSYNKQNKSQKSKRILAAFLAFSFFILNGFIKTDPVRFCAFESTDSKTQTFVLPCGIPVGLYLQTEGLLVVSTADIIGDDEKNINPAKNILFSGDYLLQMNGVKLDKKEDLVELLRKNGEKEVSLIIKRGEKIKNVKVKPVKAKDQSYKLGIWVRDDSQGIGTITFITRDNHFVALGHGINDIDVGKLFLSSTGLIKRTQIHSIIKGKKGVPGSLAGSILKGDEHVLGTITKNTKKGVYGVANEKLINELFDDKRIGTEKLKWLPVASANKVKKKTAYIRCMVSGKIEDYEIKIMAVNTKSDKNKGITFQVVDERLLKLTGGIVQGMSGSPIIQDDMVVGAVTHVFVLDPTKGYGILAENMLEN